MALQAHTLGGALSRTSDVPAASGDYTCTFWAKFVSIAGTGGAYRPLFVLAKPDYTQYVAIFGVSPVTEYPYLEGWDGVNNPTTVSLHRPIGVWAAYTYTRSGTTHTLRVNGGDAASFTFNAAALTLSEAWLAGDTDGETAFAQVQGFREWNTALTEAEILAELRSTTVVKTATLVTNTPLVSDLLDDTVNTNDWTASGTTSFEAAVVPRLLPDTPRTVVFTDDFTTASAPLYPTSAPGGAGYSLPNYWQTEDWPHANSANWGPPVAGFPDLVRAEAANISAGVGLKYTGGTSDAAIATAVFGVANPATNQRFLQWFSANYGARTIYAEANIAFEKAVYAADDAPAPTLFRIHGDSSFGPTMLYAENAGGPGTAVDFTLEWITAGHGGGSDVIWSLDGDAIPESQDPALVLKVLLEVTPSSPIGDPGTGDEGDGFNPDGILRLYLNDVLHYEDDTAYVVTAYGGVATYDGNYLVGALGLGDAGFPGWYEDVEFGYLGETEGGGEVPPGVNPEVGNLPTSFPLKYIELRIAGEVYYYGETHLNDNDTWTEAPGKKPGKLKHISKVRRELSRDGGYISSRCTVTIADTDRLFRSYGDSIPLRGVYCALWVVDDATRRAEGAPFRYFAGLITDYSAPDDFTYVLELEDVMGRRLSEYNKQPQLPPDKFKTADFPAINPAVDGTAIPLVLGLVTDGFDPNPQGVVPARFAGYLNFQTAWGGDNIDVDAYIWSQGAFATSGVYIVYYNDETTPNVRQVIPDAAWGTVVWMAGKPGYSETGLSTLYADYLGRRYASPLFVLRSHALAEAAREGRVQPAGNIYGIAETAVGGNYIDSPVKIWQFLLVNYVFNRYTNADTYFDIPTLDGTYSIIDTDTVDTAQAELEARIPYGYVAGFMLGRGGAQQTVFEALAELSVGCDFEWGINRHGQLIVSAEDRYAEPTLTFTAQSDIEDRTYRTWIDGSTYVNKVEYRYGYRYIPPVAPSATPAEGEPIPPPLDPQYNDWRSGLKVAEYTDSQEVTGEIATYELDNYATQHAQTADDVALRVLQRGMGPTGDGPRRFSFTGGWHLFGSGSDIVELGSCIGITHPARMGFVETATDEVRVTAIEVDPMRDRVTLEGYWLLRDDQFTPFVSLLGGQVFGSDSFGGAAGGDGGGGGTIDPGVLA